MKECPEATAEQRFTNDIARDGCPSTEWSEPILRCTMLARHARSSGCKARFEAPKICHRGDAAFGPIVAGQDKQVGVHGFRELTCCEARCCIHDLPIHRHVAFRQARDEVFHQSLFLCARARWFSVLRASFCARIHENGVDGDEVDAFCRILLREPEGVATSHL